MAGKPYISCTLGNARHYREGGQELEGRLQLFLIMVMMVVMMMVMMIVVMVVMNMTMMVVVMTVMMIMHWRMASESWYNMVVTKENFSQLNS